MTIIYLSETASSVRSFLQRPAKDKVRWIALSPEAMAELDKEKIKYHIPEDFYSENELWQAGIKSAEAQKRAIGALDELAAKSWDGLAKRGSKLYTNYSYPINVIFDTVFLRAFQLQAIFKALHPDEVYFHISEILPFYWRGIGFDRRELLYSRILNECFALPGVRLIGLDQESRVLPAVEGKNGRLKAFKFLIDKRIPALYEIRKKGIGHFLKRKFSRGKTIGILGSEYEWQECEDYFLKHKFIMRQVGISFSEKGDFTENPLLKDKLSGAVGTIMAFNGIDLSPLLMPRLEYIFQQGKDICIDVFDRAERFINRFNPKALLFSVLAAPEYKSAISAFSKRGIPIFSKSHGAAGAFETTKTILDNELMYADYFLANGEEVINAYRVWAGEYFNKGLKAISTGSVKLQRLQCARRPLPNRLTAWIKEKKMSGSRKVCLYATTNYLDNALFNMFYPPYSDRNLFRTQQEIIGFFSGRKDVLLVWKLHPNRFHRRPPNIEDGAGNIFVLRDEAQFTDLLGISDLVLIDSPATACLQAATTKLPIFLVMKHIKYSAAARRLLEKRAVCADGPQELLRGIDFFLNTGQYSADINDNAFLEAFGTGKDIADPAEATAGAVITALGEEKC